MFGSLNKIKGFFCNDVGIDLGTMNTLIYVPGSGIVLNEPTVVAINVDSNKVRAVGSEAKRMIGLTSERIKVIRPLKDGVIADAGVTDEMLRIFIRKATGKFKMSPPRVLIAVPSGITDPAIRAVRDSVEKAGARSVQLVVEPFAAAVGTGLPIDEPDGNMIIDIGGGTTEVAIISLSSCVCSGSIQVGGDAMDAAIMDYMKRTHKLKIGAPSAEKIKINIGSAYATPDTPVTTMEVRGMDISIDGNRLPRTVTITSDEIRQALDEPLREIVNLVSRTLNNCPEEIAARLLTNGITMSGGGSLIRGLDKRISEETGLKVEVGPDPLLAVVMGTGVLLNEANRLFNQPRTTLIGKGTL